MSVHSPHRVENSEMLAMFVFSPIQINKKGKLKPGIFDHVYGNGRSIQRDSIAKTEEILKFVKQMLGRRDDLIWKGLLLAKCHAIRSIMIEGTSKQAVCVYDTAEKDNPAHGEVCQSQYVVDEADRIELRSELWAAFGDEIISPMQYRNGMIWSNL